MRLTTCTAGIILVAVSARPVGADSPAPEHPPTVSAHALQAIAWWAVPSNNPGYIGHYVGGGCNCRPLADARRPDEGAWGWDFRGRILLRQVNLGWWHGRRYQGGTGAYKTDGPHYHEEAPAAGH